MFILRLCERFGFRLRVRVKFIARDMIRVEMMIGDKLAFELE